MYMQWLMEMCSYPFSVMAWDVGIVPALCSLHQTIQFLSSSIPSFHFQAPCLLLVVPYMLSPKLPCRNAVFTSICGCPIEHAPTWRTVCMDSIRATGAYVHYNQCLGHEKSLSLWHGICSVRYRHSCPICTGGKLRGIICLPGGTWYAVWGSRHDVLWVRWVLHHTLLPFRPVCHLMASAMSLGSSSLKHWTSGALSKSGSSRYLMSSFPVDLLCHPLWVQPFFVCPSFSHLRVSPLNGVQHRGMWTTLWSCTATDGFNVRLDLCGPTPWVAMVLAQSQDESKELRLVLNHQWFADLRWPSGPQMERESHVVPSVLPVRIFINIHGIFVIHNYTGCRACVAMSCDLAKTTFLVTWMWHLFCPSSGMLLSCRSNQQVCMGPIYCRSSVVVHDKHPCLASNSCKCETSGSLLYHAL